MDRLAGKLAVVTGAAFGNGRGIALRFAEEGADLVFRDAAAELGRVDSAGMYSAAAETARAAVAAE